MATTQANGWTFSQPHNDWYRTVLQPNGQRQYIFANSGSSSSMQAEARSVSDAMRIQYAETEFPQPGTFEELDPTYQRISPEEEWTFWKPGRVFKALWWETEGEGEPQGPSEVKYGVRAFAKVRISTHGGQAATKKGLNQTFHTIVYSGNQAPQKLAGEKKLNKDPLKVQVVDESEKLDRLSRVNLAKTYVIEHKVKVKRVGMVPPSDLKKMKGYYKDCNQ